MVATQDQSPLHPNEVSDALPVNERLELLCMRYQALTEAKA